MQYLGHGKDNAVAKAIVGVVGLGLMGSAIAGRLLDEGYGVHGFDPVPGAGDSLIALGLVKHDELVSLARSVQLVVLSLPNGSISQKVCSTEDGLSCPGPTVRWIVDTTTTRPEEARAMSAQLAPAIEFFDVGLSGSSSMVSQGHGLALVAGDTPAPDEAIAMLNSICNDVATVGKSGDGMRVKLIINMVLGINRLALAEALLMGEKMGIDTHGLLDVLSRSAASSKAMSIWGERMVESRFDNPTSRISQHTKDIRQIIELGEEYDLPMLGASTLAMLARSARAQGLHDKDNSVVIEVLRNLAGRD
jgi:3-hydroxyisobutyrate dehydrogenase-like beta-hydroxyacid dehydrogenase